MDETRAIEATGLAVWPLWFVWASWRYCPDPLLRALSVTAGVSAVAVWGWIALTRWLA